MDMKWIILELRVSGLTKRHVGSGNEIWLLCSSSARHSGKMTAHARLFSRVSSRALCEWSLEGEKESSSLPNFKQSMDGNKFSYLQSHLDFNGDALGATCQKLQTVSGL